MIKFTCIVCNKVYKEVPDKQGGVSHGYCLSCYKLEKQRIRKEIQEFRARKKNPSIDERLTQMKIGETKNIKDILLERKDTNLWVLTPWVKNQTGYPLQEIISKLVL